MSDGYNRTTDHRNRIDRRSYRLSFGGHAVRRIFEERTLLCRGSGSRDQLGVSLMGAPRTWSAAELAIIVTMRASRETWDAIAGQIGTTRTTLTKQAVRMGLWTRGITTGDTTPKAMRAEDPDRYRAPYPAGHAETWGVITAGTCLEGFPYPS
jgi:hypothetical protein